MRRSGLLLATVLAALPAAAQETAFRVMTFNVWGAGMNQGKPIDDTLAVHPTPACGRAGPLHAGPCPRVTTGPPGGPDAGVRCVQGPRPACGLPASRRGA